ncbi:MAG: sirohydrochlorin chelatase [Hyphomicrobiales bacterium]|nr:sirohydrochlorin chelatase [Hyphomicrobiales bacterium]
MGKPGIMICGHGSRDEDAVREFHTLQDGLKRLLPEHDVDSGFLEFARPTIGEGLDALRQRGNKDVVALPAMLFAAAHAKNDIPALLNDYRAHNGINIRYGRELGVTPALLQAASGRIADALEGAGGHIPREETLLLLAGRGASDPDANANVSKVMRLLWEGLGLGWGEVCYSGVTFPLTAPALDHAARMGFKRIVIFPWFLFTGVLVKRIYAAVDEAARAHPGVEFVKAKYFSDHPLILQTFLERAQEVDSGDNAMNCQLCKYREGMPGFEAEVGLPQESHHHHVEGIGTGAHAHAHTHDHDHSHRPAYPHADHPLGPASLKKE